MSPNPEGQVLVVADTSVLLNFALIDRLDLLTETGYLVHAPNHVIQEVLSHECRERVARALTSGRLVELEIVDLAEIELYATYKRRFGDGESAALAVGISRRWLIAIDEKGPTRREVIERLGPEFLLTTPLVLAAAIAHGALDVTAVPSIRQSLAENRFILEAVPGEGEGSRTPSRTQS